MDRFYERMDEHLRKAGFDFDDLKFLPSLRAHFSPRSLHSSFTNWRSGRPVSHVARNLILSDLRLTPEWFVRGEGKEPDPNRTATVLKWRMPRDRWSGPMVVLAEDAPQEQAQPTPEHSTDAATVAMQSNASARSSRVIVEELGSLLDQLHPITRRALGSLLNSLCEHPDHRAVIAEQVDALVRASAAGDPGPSGQKGAA